MIKATDLRLGNLLIYKGEVVYVTTLTLDVDDEREQTIGFCKLRQATDEVMGWERAMDLQGIGITPEWLERCGFETVKNSVGLNLLSEGDYFKIVYLFNSFPLCIEVDGNRAPLYNIKYVHQVQNIFHALTGTELEIKLP